MDPACRFTLKEKLKPFVDARVVDDHRAQLHCYFADVVIADHVFVPHVQEDVVAQVLDIYRTDLVLPFRVLAAVFAHHAVPV